MTWVKVCGMRTHQDVAAAIAAGADAVGFITDRASVRYAPFDEIAALARDVPLLTVLVTVDMEADELLAAAASTGVGGVQPHGAAAATSAAAAQDAGLFVLRPVLVADAVDLSHVPAGQRPLLDAARPGRHGGTGVTFDWSLAEGLACDFVLAGGLRPGNVAAAVDQVRPWGVDASSGLEQSPGVKDHAKIARFVEEAKSA